MENSIIHGGETRNPRSTKALVVLLYLGLVYLSYVPQQLETGWYQIQILSLPSITVHQFTQLQTNNCVLLTTVCKHKTYLRTFKHEMAGQSTYMVERRALKPKRIRSVTFKVHMYLVHKKHK